MAVVVPILSTFNDKGIKSAVREFKTAKTELQKFGAVGKIFEGVGTSLTKNVTVPLVAVTAAFGVMVKGAIDAGAAQHRLRQLLITTGGATNDQVDALIRQAEALEKVGVASKESIVTTQAQLATFDLQGSTIEKLTPAILDYVIAEKGATATSEDFKSMTNGLAQALNGQFGSLTRTGFVLDDVTKELISNGTEAERAAAIVEVLNSTYKGFNASLLDTPEGQFIKLQQEFRNLRDEVGQSLLPVFNDLMKIMRNDIVPIFQRGVEIVKNIASNFASLEPETRKNIIVFVTLVGILGPMLILVGKIIAVTKVFIGVFKALTVVMMANPIGFIVGAIALLVTALVVAYQTSDKFRAIVNNALNAVITVAENLANAFITMYNGAILPVFNKILGLLQKINPKIELAGEIGAVTFKRISEATKPLNTSFAEITERSNNWSQVLEDKVVPSLNETGSGANKLKERLDKVRKAIQDLRNAAVKAAEAVVGNLQQSLNKAQGTLDETRRKFDNFKNSIIGTISGIVNFGKAAESDDFLGGLTEQAATASEFANKIKTLIQLGLSERGIKQVLDAGFEAGTKIADELIAGGSTIVKQVNSLLVSVSSVAEQVGDQGAKEFYQAGLTQGEALVNGILDALRAAQAELAAAQKAAASGSGIPQFGARASKLLEDIGAIKGGKKRARAEEAFAASLSASGRGISAAAATNIRSRFKLAAGGIVLGPTNALIGEAGPEAVIPLSGANSARGMMGSTVNITVNAGIGTNGNQVGAQIVEAIKRYERSNAPVFSRV